MSKRKPVEIRLFPQVFYGHPNDEHMLFEWISKVTCVTDIDGDYLIIKSKRITRDDLKNLFGIFMRYRFENIEQLNVFRNKHNEDLFDYRDIPDTREKKEPKESKAE